MSFKDFYNKIIGSGYVQYQRKLAKELKDCRSVLDVGCGTDSPIKFIEDRSFEAIGVDQYYPSLEESRRKNIHDRYYCLDILKLDQAFPENCFDCVIALDVIEHLKKPQGQKLITRMSKIARKKVIIFTPNGFLRQAELAGNPWQKHLSGWRVKDFTRRGFKVYGMNGYKPLRSDLAQVKYRPEKLWKLISDLSQKIVYFFPEKAFQLFAVKKIKN